MLQTGGMSDPTEQGIEIPFEQLDPETLRNLIGEFVTRDGADWGERGGSLEEKVGQVLQQLKSRQAKIVYDLATKSANIISRR